MSLIISIETATNSCSVALSEDGKLISEEKNSTKKDHAKLLTLLIEKLFKGTNYSFSNLDAIAISQGPGSYTGLRIGTSVAKGICYAQDIPLIAINTLQSLANISSTSCSSLRCPMIDARRMEVYCQLFDAKLNAINTVEAKVLTANSFEDLLKEQTILFFGDGASKFEEICKHPNAKFLDKKNPSASQMIPLAHQDFENKKFVDIAYFTPFYLKKFQVTTSKKRLL